MRKMLSDSILNFGKCPQCPQVQCFKDFCGRGCLHQQQGCPSYLITNVYVNQIGFHNIFKFLFMTKSRSNLCKYKSKRLTKQKFD